jgi:hypothetical protein
MVQANESLDNIHRYIFGKGYSVSDFDDILAGYNPTPTESEPFWAGWFK